MGVVFRAVREPSGETVALKVLREEFAEEELYRRRFQREARIALQLVHKNIVPVLDSGEDSGHLYLASRFVPGCTLSERIAVHGRLSLAEVFRLASEMGRALDALHTRGLVHRDVKPANVMIDEDGAAALTDFGLARAIADTVLTRTGAVVGTVDYLAPELIRGERANPSSDLYAMGCLLYECLAGTPPFAGRSFVDTLIAHAQRQSAGSERPARRCSGKP